MIIYEKLMNGTLKINKESRKTCFQRFSKGATSINTFILTQFFLRKTRLQLALLMVFLTKSPGIYDIETEYNEVEMN